MGLNTRCAQRSRCARSDEVRPGPGGTGPARSLPLPIRSVALPLAGANNCHLCDRICHPPAGRVDTICHSDNICHFCLMYPYDTSICLMYQYDTSICIMHLLNLWHDNCLLAITMPKNALQLLCHSFGTIIAFTILACLASTMPKR